MALKKNKRRARRNPLAPPNLQKLLGGQSVYRPPKDIDAQVENRVNLETAPAVNAINRSRQMGQHMYQLQSEEARGWQTGLVGMLTGGKTGAEAEAYSKQNFGGSYLAGIAMQEGTKLLTQISNDFNMKDWDYAAQVAEVMDQVPGLREKFRADILSEGAQVHQMNFDNRLKLASMVLDDWYKRVGLDMAATELGFNMGATRTRLKQDQQALTIRAAAEKRQLRKDIRDENKDRREENRIDMASSIDLGVWVNKRGQVVAKPAGYPAKPPPRWKPATKKGGGKGEPFEPTPRAEALADAGSKLGELEAGDFLHPVPEGASPETKAKGGKPYTAQEAFNAAYALVRDDLMAYGYKPPRIKTLVWSHLKRFGYKRRPTQPRRTGGRGGGGGGGKR